MRRIDEKMRCDTCRAAQELLNGNSEGLQPFLDALADGQLPSEDGGLQARLGIIHHYAV